MLLYSIFQGCLDVNRMNIITISGMRFIILCLAAFASQLQADSTTDSLGFSFHWTYTIGEKHTDQFRWQSSFALAGSNGLHAHTARQSNTLIDATEHEVALHYDYLMQMSPLPLQVQFNANGDISGALFGIPLVTKTSYTSHAGETTSSGLTWTTNPWVWGGAIAIGVAAASGGGGSGGSSNNSANGTTLVGGDECNVVSGSPTNPEVVSGCGVAGNEVNVP